MTTAQSLSYLIPLDNVPEQFEILLAGVTYTIINKWNDQPLGGWVIDIMDDQQNPIVMNIPLITGEDCLSGLEYLGFGGQLIVQTTGSSPDTPPTFENLGVDSNLYFVTTSTDE
jgi:hypothetical protein